LPGVKIPRDLNLCKEINCAANSDIVIVAVPSVAVCKITKELCGVIGGKTVVVNVAKGLDYGRTLRLSQVIAQNLASVSIAVLSGPSHAEEVALGIPTSVVSASEKIEAALFVQKTLSNGLFRIYANPDIIGVELGGALKNIIAIAVGMCDSFGYGDNTIAALMTRGLTEIARLGVAMGAKKETFSGLSGLGDLIVTCGSRHSRNRRAGVMLGQGLVIDEVIKVVGTVEGYYATKSAIEFAAKFGVEMPITNEMFQILYNGKSAEKAFSDLMMRPQKSETEPAEW
jgi:glycerol-3-phosphate dehydrogenase (NAD(P)+)